MHAEFVSLLRANLNYQIYPDFIPETAKLPAASYLLVSLPRDRDLEDETLLITESWQVRVSGIDRTSVNSAIIPIIELDGTKTEYYQRITVDGPVDERAQPGVSVAAAVFDIFTTRRRVKS